MGKVSLPGEDILQYFTRLPVEVRAVNSRFRGGERVIEILDFMSGEKHYSNSFGVEWTKYRDAQIDRFNRTRKSYEHMLTITQNDLSVFRGAVCLEIGSGAGRFTDYLVELCRTVITVDPSPAIFVNVALGAPNLIPCRADLSDIPIRCEEVDVVLCRGVIQHTPRPRRSIGKLFEYVKSGGVVLFDVYPLKWYTPLMPKYWLRPFTRRVDPEKFIVWAEKWVPRLLRFKGSVVNRILPGRLGAKLGHVLFPVGDFTCSLDLVSREQRMEWSVMWTVDMYTPRYDRPMTFKAILRTLQEVGAREIQANPDHFCFKAIAP